MRCIKLVNCELNWYKTMPDKCKIINKMQSKNSPMIYPTQNTCSPGFVGHRNAKGTGRYFLKSLNDYRAHSGEMKSCNFLAMC